MTVHAWRLPFALDSLIAEANRRARQRRVLVAVAVVLVAGGGSWAAIVASGSSGSSSYRPTRPIRAAVEASVSNGGQPTMLVQGRGRVPFPFFGVAIFLRNGSREPVILERVRAVLRARSPLRQIGTRFVLFRPEVCTPGMIGCMIPTALGGGGSDATRPFDAERFSPLLVPPGHTAQGQLNFRIACTRHTLQEAVSLQKIIVTYGLPSGTQIHQRPGLNAGSPDPVVSSTGAADAWTGTLPFGSPVGVVGKITTTSCHR